MDRMNYTPDLPGFDDFIKENKQKIPKYDRDVADFFKSFEFLQEMVPEEEKVPVDTYDCDCMFVNSFFVNELVSDFPFVIREFLEHEGPNIDKYDMAWSMKAQT